MKKAYDVVVIGAGPAGSVAAQRAARAGLSTLLLEKRPEIGKPVRCAEAVGSDLCQEFIAPNPAWIDATITSFTLYNSGGTALKVPPAEPTWVVNRAIFDPALASLAAQAGAEVLTAAPATGLLIEKKQIRGVKLEYQGQSHEITARLVVAADGAEGQVARWAGLRIDPSLADYYAGVEFLLSGLAGRIAPSSCEYHFNPALAPGGYLWVFPKGEDRANVGLVFSGDRAPEAPAYTLLEKFVEARYPGADVKNTIAGGIPVTGLPKEMVAGGLVLVGDAAHQADPLTGGGINLGMIGAHLAMQVAIPALAAGDVSARRLKEYPERWRKRFGAAHASLYKLRKLITRLEPERVDRIIAQAGSMTLEGKSLGEILLAVLKNEPGLLLEARTLIGAGLVRK